MNPAPKPQALISEPLKKAAMKRKPKSRVAASKQPAKRGVKSKVEVRVFSREQPVEMVVSFKSTPAARRSLSALSDRDLQTLQAPDDGPFEFLLSTKRIDAMEPLFGAIQPRRAVRGARLTMSVVDDDEELGGLNVLTLSSKASAEDVLKTLKGDKRVAYAHVIPERYFCGKKRARGSASGGGVDPMLNRQWGLTAVRLAEAQRSAGFVEATDIVIAVIDSGVDSSHPDLSGVIFDEQNFTTGARKDTQGHGTHVAGIIAAVRNNRRGISGVCQSRKLMSLKALGPYNGPGYYRAINYATQKGARVMNFSLGGAEDPTEEMLIRRALNEGIVVVAAMGNEFAEGNVVNYPAAIRGVIGVGAVDEVDRQTGFSNTGPHIDLVAPGENVLSTVPAYPTALANGVDYEAWPGTSMATPFVTAAAALLLAKNPSLTVAQVTQALRDGADKLPGQRGFNHTYGAGRLNIAESLALV